MSLNLHAPFDVMQPPPPAYAAVGNPGWPGLNRVRDAIRLRHYSYRTEQAHFGVIRRFILLHGRRHPAETGSAKVAVFRSHLAVVGKAAVGAQQRVLAALVCRYRVVLDQERP